MNRIIAKLMRELRCAERRLRVIEHAQGEQRGRPCELARSRKSKLDEILNLTLAIDTLRQVKLPSIVGVLPRE